MTQYIPYIIMGIVAGFIIYRRVSSAINLMSYKELKSKIENGEKFVLIDVRTGKEFKAGHIPASRHISAENLPAKLKKTKKDALIVVYCKSGGRASVAKRKLEFNGYTNVISFGGVSRWKGQLEKR